MAALALELDADVLLEARHAAALLRGLRHRVPTMRQSKTQTVPELPDELRQSPLSTRDLERCKERTARAQLGTLGRGNHFLELQLDDTDTVWLTVHTGSRAIGQAITDHALDHVVELGAGGRGFAADSSMGQGYLKDAQWARAYAKANRDAILVHVIELMAELFGARARPESLFHCDHNHVAAESHFGSTWWVHRKGALSAREGEPGIVPGSMGRESYHTRGRGCPAALCSSSHGAGRDLPRGAAKRAIGRNQLLREMRHVLFDEALTDALRDEAPSAYRDIHAVMRAQRELTRIERRLRPLLVHKGV